MEINHGRNTERDSMTKPAVDLEPDSARWQNFEKFCWELLGGKA